MAEQPIRGPIPDVLALRLSNGKGEPTGSNSALAVAVAPPRARVVQSSERNVYIKKADRVTIRHRHGQIVAVIEIVSPGNKGSTNEFRAFVAKVTDLIQQGVHVMVIDLFPPTKRDPRGLHAAIWEEIEDDQDPPRTDEPLTIASYSAGPVKTAYVEPFEVDDKLPVMPLLLEPESYVLVPLEETYRDSWGDFPAALKGLLEPHDPTEVG